MHTAHAGRLGRRIRRLLVPAAALFSLACEGSALPDEPQAPSPAEPAGGGAAYDVTGDRPWTDGYVLADDPTSSSYTAPASHAFNWAGGPVTITRPAGTKGRYIVTFAGLSAVLGAHGTVKVSGFGSDRSYCKPVNAYLVSDQVEVRCFKGRTGAPVNTRFTLMVSRAAAERAFAFAHQPTGTNYTPEATGSWSPAGAIDVRRTAKGVYEVVFTNLRSQLGAGSGHAQVNAVGTDKSHCTLLEWGGEPDVYVQVACYTPAGALVDSKFSVLFLVPSNHVAYTLADQPTIDTYSPPSLLSWNPSGGGIAVTRTAVGTYTIWWVGADPIILDAGTVQVTAVGGNTQCKVIGQPFESAQVQCFAPNGTLVDAYYSVLLGS